mmetsp:Transcript_31891/g.80578  ORF Transcript_31891/g.80578 Transcript_31891/m.80578 type:complete len:211 (-) Transcript_31891:612-1244(-)
MQRQHAGANQVSEQPPAPPCLLQAMPKAILPGTGHRHEGRNSGAQRGEVRHGRGGSAGRVRVAVLAAPSKHGQHADVAHLHPAAEVKQVRAVPGAGVSGQQRVLRHVLQPTEPDGRQLPRLREQHTRQLLPRTGHGRALLAQESRRRRRTRRAPVLLPRPRQHGVHVRRVLPARPQLEARLWTGGLLALEQPKFQRHHAIRVVRAALQQR